MGTFFFIIGLILGLVGIAILVFAIMDRSGGGIAAGAGAFALALLFIAMSCMTTIQAKNVGVLTTFGKPAERTLDPGLHWKKPWQKVTELDGTIQTDEYRGDSCIYVRIGDGSRSCVTLTNRWRIQPKQADTIYADFRSDDPTKSFRDAVISTQLKAAAQEVLAKYNPIAGLEVVEGKAAATADMNFAPDYDQVSQDILESMKTRLGDEEALATISSITVSYVSLSDSTQAQVDNFIAEVGKTRVALQRQATASAEAAANMELADSISNDPNVLVSKCLDLVAEGAGRLPAGFTCWPGGSSAVVVPGGAR